MANTGAVIHKKPDQKSYKKSCKKNGNSKSFLQRTGESIGKATVGALSNTFNFTTTFLIGALYLNQYGENPLDGLNNFLGEKQIKAIEASPHQNANLLYPAQLEQKQFTFYADTNHSDHGIRDFFFSAQNTQHLINGGVKHVFIEYPADLQYLVENLQNGVIDKQAFISELSSQFNPLWWTPEQTSHYHGSMADMILRLNEEGVAFHFVDSGLYDSTMSDESKDILMDIAGHLVEQLNEEGLYLQAMDSLTIFFETQKFIYQKTLIDPGYRERLQTMGKDLLEKRLGVDNINIANSIQELSGDDRAAILYGAAHMLRDHDLDEMLGKEKTQLISLYSTNEKYGDALYNAVVSLILTQTPDFIHTLDQNRIYDLREQPAEQANTYQLAHM